MTHWQVEVIDRKTNAVIDTQVFRGRFAAATFAHNTKVGRSKLLAVRIRPHDIPGKHGWVLGL